MTAPVGPGPAWVWCLHVKGRRVPRGEEQAGCRAAPGPGQSLSGPSLCPQSLGEMQQLQKTLTSPADAAGFLQGSRDSGGSSKDSSCDTDDFVMVPAQFPGRAPVVWGDGGWALSGLLGANSPSQLGCRVKAKSCPWSVGGRRTQPHPLHPTLPDPLSTHVAFCRLGEERHSGAPAQTSGVGLDLAKGRGRRTLESQEPYCPGRQREFPVGVTEVGTQHWSQPCLCSVHR